MLRGLIATGCGFSGEPGDDEFVTFIFCVKVSSHDLLCFVKTSFQLFLPSFMILRFAEGHEITRSMIAKQFKNTQANHHRLQHRRNLLTRKDTRYPTFGNYINSSSNHLRGFSWICFGSSGGFISN